MKDLRITVPRKLVILYIQFVYKFILDVSLLQTQKIQPIPVSFANVFSQTPQNIYQLRKISVHRNPPNEKQKQNHFMHVPYNSLIDDSYNYFRML